jgi:alpha-glucosidase
VPVLPDGVWRAFSLVDGDGADRDLPVLLLGAGHVLPVGPIMQHSGEKPLDELELIVCLDEDGKAEGMLYEDAGDGYGYRDGEYRLTRYTAVGREGIAIVTSEVIEGDWPRAERPVTVRVLSEAGEKRAEGTEGNAITIRR